LVLLEGVDEVTENGSEERLEFWTGFLLERSERRATRFLHSFVVVETHLQ
jgi:hypothetical protein